MNCHPYFAAFGSLSAALFGLSLGYGTFVSNAIAQAQAPPEASATPAPLPNHKPAPNLVECSPDGEFLVLGAPDGRLKYIRTADGVPLRTFYHCQPTAVAFSPDGTLLVTAGATHGKQGKIKVWSLVEGALVCRIPVESATNLHLYFSNDGQWLVGAGPDSRLHLWQLPQGTLRRSTTLPGDVIRVAFTQNSTAVIGICADGSTERFDIP
jgi:WD40 repeat protein